MTLSVQVFRVLILISCLVPAAAFARTEDDRILCPVAVPSDPALATRQFDEAVAAFKARRFEAALDAALSAWENGGSADALELVGVAALQSQRPFLAYFAYAQLVGLTSAPAGVRTRAENQVRALQRQATLVPVEVEPPGATVLVDGRGAGRAPLPGPILLFPGRWVVVARWPTGPEATAVVAVPKRGGVRIRLVQEVPVVAATAPPPSSEQVVQEDAPPPVPAPAEVSISDLNGRSLEVKVDGRSVGVTPWSGVLAPGRREVAIEGGGWRGGPVDLDVAAGQSLEVRIESLRLDGHLEVAAGVGEVVRLDGQVVSEGKTFDGVVPVGVHRVTLIAIDGRAAEQTVVVVPGERTTTRLVLAGPAVPSVSSEGPEVETRVDADEDRSGAYGTIELGPVTQVAGRTVIPCAGAAGCTTDDPIGGSIRLSGGYNFDPFGVDVQFIATGDFSARTRKFSEANPGDGDPLTPRTEDYKYLRLSGFLGVGPRYRLGHGIAGLSTGGAFGAVYRRMTLTRTIRNGPSDAFTLVEDALSPAGAFDVALLLGRGSDTHFQLSVFTQIDAPGTDASTRARSNDTIDAPGGRAAAFSRPSYSLSEGVQIYLGFMVGFRFGE